MFGLGKKKQEKDFMGNPDFQKSNQSPPFSGNPSQPIVPGFNPENDGFEDFGDGDIFPESPPKKQQHFHQERPTSMNMGAPSKEEVEEISESIFSEKTNELLKKIDEVKDWQKKVISRLDLQEKEIGYLRGNMNTFKTGVVGRIEEMRKDIKEISIEIKVMEKIFSEIMPAFVDNIKELSELIDKLKGKSLVAETKKSSKRR